MYLARHHQAGRQILKAILKGERAAEAAYADVGAKDQMEKDEVPKIDTRHQFKLPPNSTRPDIVLVTRKPRTKHKFSNITLVELKFCRDSDPTPQLNRATDQHTALKDHLEQQYQCSIQITPILIGVTGAIYHNHTAAALQQLGVRGSLLKATLRGLHTQAVKRLRDIVSARRRLERHTTQPRGKAAGQTARGEPREGTRPRAAGGHRDNG
jgi:hypothetical protein